MANIRLEPPEPFDFKTPDEWEKWRRRFEQFRVASGLSGESGKGKSAPSCTASGKKQRMFFLL